MVRPLFPSSRSFAMLFLAATACGGLRAQEVATPADAPPAAASSNPADEPSAQPAAQPGETVTVTASRVTVKPEPLADQPARVVRITRAQIEAAGAATLAEILQRYAGVDLYDQTGNGREMTLSLRGESDKSGVTLLYGGIPLNAVDDHRADLHLVSPAALEGIEIYFGASPFGAGAHAAVINLLPRGSNGLPMLDVTLRGELFSGNNPGWGGALSGGTRVAGWDIALQADRDAARGYRANGAWHESLLGLRAAHALGAYSFALTAGSSDSRYGEPGALTRAEMQANGAYQNPYNAPDYSRLRSRRFGAELAGPVFSALDFRVTAFLHDRTTDTLSTGRFASSPYGYGFYSINRQETLGSAGELAWKIAPSLTLSAGYEYRRESLNLNGYTRNASGAPVILYGASSDENSRADAHWKNGGLSLRAAWKPAVWLVGDLSLRRDSNRMDYHDALQACNPAVNPAVGPAVGSTCSRSFTGNGYRAGLTAHPVSRLDLFAAQGEGYTLPSVFDLYAFPLYGSNPALSPERSRTREIGARWRDARWGAGLTLFETRFDGEVQFVLTDPANYIGVNQNVGNSRRRGGELEGWFTPNEWVSLRGAFTRQSAVFLAGASTTDYGPYPPVQVSIEGRTVPLVPRTLFSAGVQVHPLPHFDLGLDYRSRSSSVLSNDLQNQRDALGFRVPASQRWDLSGGYDAAHWKFTAKILNLSGNSAENRGITNGFTDYYTPAPPLETRVALTIKLPW